MAPDATSVTPKMAPERWQQIKALLAAALEVEPPARPAFLDHACAQDPSMRPELDRLLAATEKAGPDFLNSGGIFCRENNDQPLNYWIGRRVGAYQIVERIGVGGMGEVYRAIRADEQYQKEVAIKLVRSGQGSELILNRFKNERQILATLDHPNIARLLDGGTTEEGLSYFVMELIDGQPIDKYFNQGNLPVAERLELFLQVCLAVQYAHQHLIIHRDIKPSNILVTQEGIPKLLDFGIAKLLDVAAVENLIMTTTLFQVLTPRYASPEQVKGETITTASDVYSLGVVLYELLTGRTPYRVATYTPEELSRAVKESDPARPSDRCAEAPSSTVSQQLGDRPAADPAKLSKALRGDLDNIILMALRKEPQLRYSSVEQFAEDIRRHSHSLPVRARKGTSRYRTSKFIRRHKAGVGASTVAILALILGVVITLREARIAQANELRAEQRFNDVRALATSLLFDIHDSISDLPGSTPARKLIVERALQYLDGLAKEPQADSSLQHELATAYKRIGDVQGYELSENLGDLSGALASYQKALRIRETLARSGSATDDDTIALAECYRLVSQTQLFMGELSSALENAGKAVETAESLSHLHGETQPLLRELFQDYQGTANILGGDLSLSNLGRNNEAVAYRRKQLNAAERLVGLNPSNETNRGTHAIAIVMLGDQLSQDGDRSSALRYYDQARPIFEDLAVHSSKRPRATYLLGQTWERIASARLANGEVVQAADATKNALQITERLSAQDPQNARSTGALAEVYSMRADLESRLSHSKAASSDLAKAKEVTQRLVKLSPENTETRNIQAAVYTTAGNIEDRSGNYRRALSDYEDALAVLARVQSTSPQNAGARQRVAATYNKIGKVRWQLNDLQGAAEDFRKAQTLASPEAYSSSPSVQALYTIADSFSGLGDIEADLSKQETSSEHARFEHLSQAQYHYQESLKGCVATLASGGW